jgi:hypothetical protein
MRPAKPTSGRIWALGRVSWLRLEYQYRSFLFTDGLRRDVKAIELGHQQRSARTGSGLDLGDHFVAVGVLLLVDVDPPRRGLWRTVPTPAVT